MVSVDLMGPKPRSDRGNTWVLVMQDRYTKWVELSALSKATSAAVAKALKEQIILRFGTPKSVVSDNGCQFIGREFTQLLEEYKIEHRRTPPYTPQCNPVGRTNKVIKTAINQYLGKSQKKWDALLPELAFAYNSAASDSTGYTPAYLNYGRELIPPGSLYQEQGKRPDVPCQDRIRWIQEALELAGTKLAQSFQKQQKYYNLRRRDNAKMAPKYEGPFLVHSKRAPVIFDLKHPSGKIVKHIHVRDLKPFQEPGEGGESEPETEEPVNVSCYDSPQESQSLTRCLSVATPTKRT